MYKIIDRKIFWNPLDKALKKYNKNDEIITYLIHYLKEKTNEEIFNFAISLDELLLESYNDRLWCAAYLVNADISEDSFDFFRLWLISKGKDIYDEIVMNADNLINYINKYDDFYENEDFFFIASQAYFLKNLDSKINIEEAFEIYLDALDNYKESIGYIDSEYPNIKFTWNFKNPETMKNICPRLYEKLYIID